MKTITYTYDETSQTHQEMEQILKDIPYGGEATVSRIRKVVENGSN